MGWGVIDSAVSNLTDSPQNSIKYSDAFIAIETEPPPVANHTSPLDLIRTSMTGKCHTRGRGQLRDKYPGGPSEVRRPFMGLQLKAERHAFLQVYAQDGSVIPLYNQVGGWSGAKESQDKTPGEGQLEKAQHFTDFLITSVQEQRTEKVQVVETFGEDYLYATGSRPQVLAVSGYLCNSTDFPWRAQFWSNYNRYLRGSKLLENKYTAYFGWDDIMVEGYILSAGASETAQNQDIVNFNFSFLVTDYISLAEMSFDNILRNLERTDLPAFWEVTQRGEPRIYSDNNIVLTSEGMRARQRFIQLSGKIGPFADLLRVNPALIDQLVGDPTQYLSELGKRAAGTFADKGIDLIWDGLGKKYDKAMQLKNQSCSKSGLTGKMLYEEGWQTATGWINKMLTIMERTGVPVPDNWPTMWWDLKRLMTNPLTFLEIVTARTAGDKGFAAIGAIAASVLAGAFVIDFASTFVPAGSTLTAMKSGTNVAKDAIF
jgi:hypothetical protein